MLMGDARKIQMNFPILYPLSGMVPRVMMIRQLDEKNGVFQVSINYTLELKCHSRFSNFG